MKIGPRVSLFWGARGLFVGVLLQSLGISAFVRYLARLGARKEVITSLSTNRDNAE